MLKLKARMCMNRIWRINHEDVLVDTSRKCCYNCKHLIWEDHECGCSGRDYKTDREMIIHLGRMEYDNYLYSAKKCCKL